MCAIALSYRNFRAIVLLPITRSHHHQYIPNLDIPECWCRWSTISYTILTCIGWNSSLLSLLIRSHSSVHSHAVEHRSMSRPVDKWRDQSISNDESSIGNTCELDVDAVATSWINLYRCTNYSTRNLALTAIPSITLNFLYVPYFWPAFVGFE